MTTFEIFFVAVVFMALNGFIASFFAKPGRIGRSFFLGVLLGPIGIATAIILAELGPPAPPKQRVRRQESDVLPAFIVVVGIMAVLYGLTTVSAVLLNQ